MAAPTRRLAASTLANPGARSGLQRKQGRYPAPSAAAALDWRSDYDAPTYEVVEVPPDVECGVKELMLSLRLRFGAFDFLVTPEGRWVFLEVNPNGQWAWIEQMTGMPIASALADALTMEANP